MDDSSRNALTGNASLTVTTMTQAVVAEPNEDKSESTENEAGESQTDGNKEGTEGEEESSSSSA